MYPDTDHQRPVKCNRKPGFPPRQAIGSDATLKRVSNVANIVKPVDGSEAAAAGQPLALAEQELIDQLNRGYVCPPGTGPIWRAACEAGVDMSLIEDALQMRPAERLREHQRALNQILTLLEARRSHEHDSGSREPS